jgi:hypothetical protein
VRGIHFHHHTKQQIGTIMTKQSDEILTDTYGRNAPDAAKFGKGATSREQIDEATAAQRASSNASAPRKYGER